MRRVRSLRRCAVLALLAPLLAGCVGYRLVEPGVVRADGIEMRPTAPWNRFESPANPRNTTVWTAEGPLLDRLLLISALEPGRSLVNRPDGRTQDPMPTFRADMPPEEVVEFVVASLQRGRVDKDHELTGLAPQDFGGHPGTRFTFRSLSRDDLEREGVGLAAVVDGKLYLVLFEGTRLYHFGLRAPEVEAMLKSARIVGG